MNSFPKDPNPIKSSSSRSSKPTDITPLLFVLRDVEEETEFSEEKGDRYYRDGNYSKAFDIYQEVLTKLLAEKAANASIDNSNIVRKMGLCFLKMGDYESAQSLFNNALKTKQSSEIGDDGELAQLIGNLGQSYLGDAKYTEALVNFQKSFDMTIKQNKENRSDLAICYNNFAELCEAQGKYHEALEYIDKAINVMSNIKDDDTKAFSLYLKGKTYLELADYSKALQFTEESLKLRESLYGAQNHPDIGFCYNSIGNICLVQGRYSEALDHYKTSLEIRRIFLGDFHPSVAGSFNNIAIVEMGLGNYNQALENYKKCLKTEIDFFGENHPEVGSTYNNIANVFNKTKQYEEALKYYNKALSIRVQAYGDNHPDVATTYNNMGIVHRDQGETDVAEAYFRKSIQIRLRNAANKHPEIANSYVNLGFIYSEKKNFPKALESFIEALKVRLHVFGNEHKEVAMCYYNIAVLLRSMRNIENFENCIQRCQMIYKRTLGEGHNLTKLVTIASEETEKEKAQLCINEI